MNRIAYNISITLAVLLIGIGTGAQCGWPMGCIVVGLLVLVLTFVGLRISAPKRAA